MKNKSDEKIIKLNKFGKVAVIFFTAILSVLYFCNNSEKMYCLAKTENRVDSRIKINSNSDEEKSVLEEKTGEIPEWVSFNEKTVNYLTDDNKKVKAVLTDKRVTVYLDDKKIWNSPEEFLIQDIFAEDVEKLGFGITQKNQNFEKMQNINGRDSTELILLLWKNGRYGNHKPFWTENEDIMSQHIFLYNVAGDKVMSKWGSSYTDTDIDKIQIKNNRLFTEDINGNMVAWYWENWGFVSMGDGADIVVAGDNLIHKGIYNYAMKENYGSFVFLYDDIKSYVREADFAVVNQETPLVEDEKDYSDYPQFGTPKELAEALKYAGFDAVTLSNNHFLDKGKLGIETTLREFEKQDMITVGSSGDKPYRKTIVNGIKIALLNYTYGTNGKPCPKEIPNAVYRLNDEEKIRNDIKLAKSEADAVFVFVHWGEEYSKEVNLEQEKWRNLFYEEGVNVVIGTHPHVLQKYELYSDGKSDKKMLVYYSLGNLVSTNSDKNKNQGGLGRFKLCLKPEGVEISEYGLAELVIGGFADKYKVRIK